MAITGSVFGVLLRAFVDYFILLHDVDDALLGTANLVLVRRVQHRVKVRL